MPSYMETDAFPNCLYLAAWDRVYRRRGPSLIPGHPDRQAVLTTHRQETLILWALVAAATQAPSINFLCCDHNTWSFEMG